MTLFDVDELTRRYEVQRHIAITLQENFLHPLPTDTGLELGLVSKTAFEPELVGGDFSDVFVVDDTSCCGADRRRAGKGVKAAGHTETVRAKIRALRHDRPIAGLHLGQDQRAAAEVRPRRSPRDRLSRGARPPHRPAELRQRRPPRPRSPGRTGLRRPLEVAFGPPLGSFARPYENAHGDARCGGLPRALHRRRHRGPSCGRALRRATPARCGLRPGRRLGPGGCRRRGRRRACLRRQTARRPTGGRRAAGLTFARQRLSVLSVPPQHGATTANIRQRT